MRQTAHATAVMATPGRHCAMRCAVEVIVQWAIAQAPDHAMKVVTDHPPGAADLDSAGVGLEAEVLEVTALVGVPLGVAQRECAQK
jgi:hypothetical protein